MRLMHARLGSFLLCFACGLRFGPQARALDWHSGTGFRDAALLVTQTGKTGFTALAQSITGIAFTNHLSDSKAADNQIRLVGSGVALGDVDGDGWCDIY